MKIYNEVTSRFNETTGKWETISEDSFDYNGPMAMAAMIDEDGGNLTLPTNAVLIEQGDTITDTLKTTAGYFTNGDGTLEGSALMTGSLADSNENYYVNIVQTHPLSASAETQFSVAFGHVAGSGSNAVGDGTDPSNLKTATEAVYKQFASLLLPESETVSSASIGGFKISQQGSAGAISSGNKDEYIYILTGKRARFKDRLNKKTWTMTLSGSNSVGAGLGNLSLTDDSAFVAGVATPGGIRYNIVSGALGLPTGSDASIAKDHRTFGWYYPEMGCMVFSGAELSASIPGPYQGAAATAPTWDNEVHFEDTPGFHADNAVAALSSSGFEPLLNNDKNMKNHIKLAQCLKNVNGVALRLRSEEDQTQENYFCRVKAGDFNFSTNPTFVSGSDNEIRNANMIGNPTTFITGVGLYNASGHLVATAKLSSPLKKDFVSEATIKVKLTY